MALVVLLRGVNVGGHKTFRPKALAEELAHLDVVNIGATGTFVVRRAVTQAKLRAELTKRLPFATEIVICPGRAIVKLTSTTHFADRPVRADIVRFVSVLSKSPRALPKIPLTLPPTGKWFVEVLARDGRYVFGVYRRDMKVIAYLGELDRLFGGKATTRNWNTITAIAKVLGKA